MRRRRLSRRSSRRNFSSGARSNRRNRSSRPMRGGIRI